jgi:hypothetical protein
MLQKKWFFLLIGIFVLFHARISQGARLNIPGGAFRPESQLQQFNISDNSVLTPNSITSFGYTFPIFLPANAKITRVSMFINDNEASINCNGYLLKRYPNPVGQLETIVSLSSSGNSLLVNEVAVSIDHVVDESSVYFLRWVPNASIKMALWSFVIQYNPPGSEVYIPLIQK